MLEGSRLDQIVLSSWFGTVASVSVCRWWRNCVVLCSLISSCSSKQQVFCSLRVSCCLLVGGLVHIADLCFKISTNEAVLGRILGDTCDDELNLPPVQTTVPGCWTKKEIFLPLLCRCCAVCVFSWNVRGVACVSNHLVCGSCLVACSSILMFVPFFVFFAGSPI